MVVMELTLPGLAAASSAKTPLTRCSFPSAASADCVASRVTHRFRMTMLPPRSCPILGLAHHCTGGHQTGGARTTRVIGDAMSTAIGSGTKDDPWVLKTAPGVSEYQMYRDASADPPELVGPGGGTQPWGGRSRRGGARRPIQPAAGTGSRRASAAVSACTCHLSWRLSGWPSSNTTLDTTGCAHCSRSLVESLTVRRVRLVSDASGD